MYQIVGFFEVRFACSGSPKERKACQIFKQSLQRVLSKLSKVNDLLRDIELKNTKTTDIDIQLLLYSEKIGCKTNFTLFVSLFLSSPS